MQKFTTQILFALALGGSVTGCAVGPNYRRPSVNLQPFQNAPFIEARSRVSQLPSKEVSLKCSGAKGEVSIPNPGEVHVEDLH